MNFWGDMFLELGPFAIGTIITKNFICSWITYLLQIQKKIECHKNGIGRTKSGAKYYCYLCIFSKVFYSFFIVNICRVSRKQNSWWIVLIFFCHNLLSSLIPKRITKNIACSIIITKLISKQNILEYKIFLAK